MQQTARQHLVLFDDPSQCVGTPADAASSANANASANASALGVSLPHPRSGRPRRYALLDGRLRELVRVAPASPSAWFVDQAVRSGA